MSFNAMQCNSLSILQLCHCIVCCKTASPARCKQTNDTTAKLQLSTYCKFPQLGSLSKPYKRHLWSLFSFQFSKCMWNGIACLDGSCFGHIIICDLWRGLGDPCKQLSALFCIVGTSWMGFTQSNVIFDICEALGFKISARAAICLPWWLNVIAWEVMDMVEG